MTASPEVRKSRKVMPQAARPRCSRLPFLGVAVFAATVAFSAGSRAGKSNVVLFLVDDMGWMDCGAYGSKFYATPNIDRFARRAMRFTDAYATPLCSPTRATILSGQYTARHGVLTASGHLPPQRPGHVFLAATAAPNRPLILPESRNYLDPSHYTLAEALRDGGWKTGHVGKWHLGLTEPHWPEKHGFDYAVHAHPDPSPPSYFSPYRFRSHQSYADGPPGEYITDRLTDEAITFIEANRERPFFLNLWHHGVHGPWGHKEVYTREFVSKKDPRGKQGNPIMASMLKSVDESFGRILDTLDRLRLTENTIVIFFSDNGGNVHSNTSEDERSRPASKETSARFAAWRKWAGNRPPTSNAPLRMGKATLYEGGVRVPLMWAGPGVVRPGTTSSEVVGAIDLYPTILEALGVALPEGQRIDGVSFVSALRAGAKLERAAYFQYFPQTALTVPGVSVRAGEWKLIRWFETNANYPAVHELYNLHDDLGELKNLATEQPARVRELDALIDDFLIKTGATCPRTNPAFRSGAPPATRKKVSVEP